MSRYFLVITATIALTFLAGCRTPQTVKDAWKGTQSVYREYLNTPAKLDLEDKGDIEDHQAALGAAVADFDMQLIELERVLQNSDRNPDAAWVSAMTTRFPWLSGLTLTDELGIPRAQVPPNFPKPFDIGNMGEVDPKQQIKDLRAHLQQTELGPEVYLANPVYIGEDFRGLILAHFDPRTLLARVGDPSRVVLAGPEGVIWPGHYAIESTPLQGVNWAEKVKSEPFGVISNEHGSFYWVSRYLGNLPLVYAIRVKGEFPLREENMQALSQAASFALGSVSFAQPGESAEGEPAPGNDETPRHIDVAPNSGGPAEYPAGHTAPSGTERF